MVGPPERVRLDEFGHGGQGQLRHLGQLFDRVGEGRDPITDVRSQRDDDPRAALPTDLDPNVTDRDTHRRPTVAEELRRVIPVVSTLAAEGARVSVDTMRAEVAEAALDAGALLVNDVSGGLADPAMLPLVAAREVPLVLMHWRGHSVDMQDRAAYGDVVAEVCRELAARRDAALAAGIRLDRLVLDPGLGFAKLAEHNWTLLARLSALADLGLPLLLGASRKAFLGKVGRPEGSVPRPPIERDAATAATSVLAALAGVWAVRVHDVRSTRDALDVVEASLAHGGVG